jgi:hypothetical protein
MRLRNNQTPESKRPEAGHEGPGRDARGFEAQELEAQEKELEQVLAHFRQSVHAWSEAELSRPRTLAPAAPHRSWRIASAWALGCVLAAGSLAGGLYDRHHRQELAAAAAREARAQQQAAEQQLQAAARQQDAKLFADMDRDVSQEVPSAMEPLAQLMDDTNP